MFGHPDAYLSWNFSLRGLVEDLAQHNDILLVLDDFEKNVGTRALRGERLQALTQAVPDGHTKAIAQIAKDGGLPPLTWSTIAFSGSPKPLDQLAAELGHMMSQGEMVRVIDIPVPDRESGGIFDRLTSKGLRRQRAARRAARLLQRELMASHGTLFPAWIEYLQRANHAQELVAYREQFVRQVCPTGNSWERRLAEKFGLLMAAGQLAVEAKLLDWPQHWPMTIMRSAYERHKVLTSHTPVDSAKDLLRRLAKSIEDTDLFLWLEPGEVALFGANTLGMHHRHCGEATLAIRDEMLTSLAGNRPIREALDSLISEKQLRRGGQGGKRTTQIRRRCIIDDRQSETPRFLLISVPALRQWAATS